MQPALCPQSIQSSRAAEHSAGHVTRRSAFLAAGCDERRRIRTHCLGHHYTIEKYDTIERYTPSTASNSHRRPRT